MRLEYISGRFGLVWADLLRCASCNHTHEEEAWPVPLIMPRGGRCVNCGAPMAQTCERCELTHEESRALHKLLAARVSPGPFWQTARTAFAANRMVLATKLSTASLIWEGVHGDAEAAHAIRAQALLALGMEDQAYDQLLTWTSESGSARSWKMLADVEAEAGNVPGVLHALEGSLRAAPRDSSLWADYAEMLVLGGRHDQALDTAIRLLGQPDVHGRAMAIVVDTAQHLMSEGHHDDAAYVALRTGEYIDGSAALCWLMAQVCGLRGEIPQHRSWVKRVLAVEPGHPDALAAYGALGPEHEGGAERPWWRRVVPWGSKS